MRHLSILFAFLLASVIQVSAKYLTSAEVYNTALSHSQSPASRSSSLTQAYKTQAYTVFNISSGGFVIVSNSDKAHPILGYSRTGTFNKNNIPYILEQFSKDITYAETNNIEVKKPVMSRTSSRQNIQPLCKSRWDQGRPYNNYCPNMGEYNALTGCVAVSMAQIMSYHQYPEHGTGTHKHWKYGEIDLDTCKFDYSKMLINYGYDTPWETSDMHHNISAIMKACGYVLDMKYGTSVSSAYSSNIMKRLIEYFDYSTDAEWEAKSRYKTDAEWEDVIYSSLLNNCPVEYNAGVVVKLNEDGSVNATKDNHSWVCDGYEDGYFHMNFGWGGASDGFFKLNSIYDYTLPGYEYVTGAIVNLHPNKPNTRKSRNINPTGTVSVNSIANINLYNPYIVDGEFKFGYTLTNNSDSIYVPVNDINILSGESTSITLSDSDIKSWNNIKTGIYKITSVADNKEIIYKETSDSIYMVYTPDEIKISKSKSGLSDVLDNMYSKNFNITKLGNLKIEVQSVNPDYDIEVYGFSGNLVYKGNDTTIALPKSGMYIVHNGKANKVITIK